MGCEKSSATIQSRRYWIALVSVAISTLLASANSLSAQAIDSSAVLPEAGSLSAGVEFNGSSRFVWRGMSCSDDAVVQASAWAAAGSWTFSVWANYDVKRTIGDDRLNEVDYTLEYCHALGPVGLIAGFSVYSYRGQGHLASDGEVYLETAWESSAVQPFARFSKDVGEYSGAYFGSAGVRVSLLARDRFGVEFESSVGWASASYNNYYFGEKKAAWDVATFDLNCPLAVTESVTLTPKIEVSELLDQAIRVTVDKPRLANFSIMVGLEI